MGLIGMIGIMLNAPLIDFAFPAQFFSFVILRPLRACAEVEGPCGSSGNEPKGQGLVSKNPGPQSESTTAPADLQEELSFCQENVADIVPLLKPVSILAPRSVNAVEAGRQANFPTMGTIMGQT